MKTAFLSPVLGSLSLTLATFALPAIGAPTVYEMRLTTSGGMGAGGGMAAMFGAMSGGSSVTRSMHLQLTSPSDIPAGYDANHTVPDAMRIGPQLPLRGERRSGGSGGAPGEDRKSVV